jgi:hypothetical protein
MESNEHCGCGTRGKLDSFALTFTASATGGLAVTMAEPPVGGHDDYSCATTLYVQLPGGENYAPTRMSDYILPANTSFEGWIIVSAPRGCASARSAAGPASVWRAGPLSHRGSNTYG